jgi:hypothetical protein
MHQETHIDQIPNTEIRLFRHRRRPQWGVAGLVWERDGKRGYQFADGKLRAFKEGFYGLFQSALPPGDGSAKAVRRLVRLAQADGVTNAAQLPTIRDQIVMFRRRYPEGFAGAAWRSKYRGEGARRRLKRHRDAAIVDAKRGLGAQALDDAIARAAWGEVHDSLVELLSESDLVSSVHWAKLRRVAPSRELTQALRAWLHDCSTDALEQDRHFNALVRVLGDAATWPLVSAIGGLVHPTVHTCVRESTFALQGKMLLSEFSIDRRPTGSDYRRLSYVADTVRSELDEAGLAPQDLLDVYDFIWLTLRPAARDDLLSVPLVTACLAGKVETPSDEREAAAA